MPVRLVELYDTASSISDGAEALIISWQVPTGYVAELIGLGVVPDYDPDAGTSYLDGVSVAVGTSPTRIGKKFDHSNFSANYGKNILSYGGDGAEQPLFEIRPYLTSGSLTYKFAEGKYIQIVGSASGGTASNIKARAKVLLIPKEEVPMYYGVDASRFTTLPGGQDQEKPVLLYAEYFDNLATSGNSKWEDLTAISIQDWEAIRFTHIGVTPAEHADALKLYDNRTKEEIPDREPYWKITTGVNMLPFGGDTSKQPMYALPSFIANKEFNNTTVDIQIRDDGTALSAGDVRVQVLGVYRVL